MLIINYKIVSIDRDLENKISIMINTESEIKIEYNSIVILQMDRIIIIEFYVVIARWLKKNKFEDLFYESMDDDIPIILSFKCVDEYIEVQSYTMDVSLKIKKEELIESLLSFLIRLRKDFMLMTNLDLDHLYNKEILALSE